MEKQAKASKAALKVQPFLKWAGGKRQLLPAIREFAPKAIDHYCEPFLGGGAVLFDLRPKKALVNDANHEIINVYEVIRDRLEELIDHLGRHRNTAEYYYDLRELDREDDYSEATAVERASRIIYLNKTCYNGLFRVNSQGQFNVPFGKYRKPNIVNEAVLRAVSAYLNRAQVRFTKGDFAAALAKVTDKSFVYLDPPYHPLSSTSSFTGYYMGGFGEPEQERLKQACDRLDAKGCRFLLSNSHCNFILDLYKGYDITPLEASRSINSKGQGRGRILEVLIKNY